jgi:hypothetical protein
MSIICPENGLLACSHGPLELAQSVEDKVWLYLAIWLGNITRVDDNNRFKAHRDAE